MPTNPSHFMTTARLGKNPKVSFINNGGNTKVAGLNLAIDDDYQTGNGWVEQTVWVYAECFGARADYVERELKAGDEVLVTGKLKMATNADGKQWHKFWIDSIRRVSRPEHSQPQQQRQAAPQRPYNEEEDLGPAFPSDASGADDVPF